MKRKLDDKSLTNKDLELQSADSEIRKKRRQIDIEENSDENSDTQIFDIKGFDIHAMLQLCNQIKEKTLKNLGGFIGPVVMPKKRKDHTQILRAPHVYKRSMDKFCRIKYKLRICIERFSQIADAITSINLPYAVTVRMKQPKELESKSC